MDHARDTTTGTGILEPSAPRKRIPAGENPEKRRQILDGARRVFSQLGFDATSVSDIAREAGVSKGTLYVYFENKEQLFAAIVDQERQHIQADLFAALDQGGDVAETLRLFGGRFARLMTTDRIVRAQRVVVSMAERMPDLTRAFFEAGPQATVQRLARYLIEQDRAGHLRIADPDLAAAQFIELSQTLLARPRLYYAVSPGPADDAAIARTVDAAVTVFLAAYGTRSDQAITSRA